MTGENIEKILYDTLVPTHDYYPSVAPEGSEAPYLVSTVFETDADTLCGQTAETLVTIQLDVYARTPFAAKEEALEAFESLAFLSPTDVRRVPTFENDTKLYRYMIEFNILM